MLWRNGTSGRLRNPTLLKICLTVYYANRALLMFTNESNGIVACDMPKSGPFTLAKMKKKEKIRLRLIWILIARPRICPFPVISYSGQK
jgi:hypothetical protein